MNLIDEISTIEADLKGAGVSLDDVLTSAKVNRSTWTRWKNGSVRGARYDTIAKVKEAAETALETARSA